MKNIFSFLLIVFCFLTTTAQAEPLGTGFTYQGELNQLGLPANGSYDFEFEIFDVDSLGSGLAAPIELDDITVSDGIFTVELDFGLSPFSGDQLWLAIGVRNGVDESPYTNLTPRQKITVVPFALHAESVAMNSVGSDEAISSEVQLRVSGSCAVGSSIRSIGEDGLVTCQPDTDTQLSESEVDGFVSDNGFLTSITPNSIGSTQVNGSQVQLRVSSTCSAGSWISAIGPNGTVTCQALSNQNFRTTSCVTTGFINTYENDFDFTCPANQVLTGVNSDFSTSDADRIFQFRCCTISAQ